MRKAFIKQDEQVKIFMADPDKFCIDPTKAKIHLSPIFEWYGEDFNHRPRKPKKLPQWVNPDDIEKLKDRIRSKKTGRRTIKRDLMLVDFACKTGLRRT